MSKLKVPNLRDQLVFEFASKNTACANHAPGTAPADHAGGHPTTRSYVRGAAACRAVQSQPAIITPREAQVLKFVAEGLTNRQTAAQMEVSVKTVEKHRQSIMNKLRLHDTAALTRYAVGRGMNLKPNSYRILADGLAASSGSGACAGGQRGTEKVITSREMQVLKLIAQSKVNKEIAWELHLSIKTVMNHRQGLMNRLDIHEVAGLTRYAISKGLVVPGLCFPTAAPQMSVHSSML